MYVNASIIPLLIPTLDRMWYEEFPPRIKRVDPKLAIVIGQSWFTS